MTDRELIAAVARDALADVSPAELPLFPAVEQAFFDRGRLIDPDRESALGFGLAAEVAALAPAALTIATEVSSFVASQFGETAKKEGAAVISAHVKAAFKKFRSDKDTVPALDPTQLARVRAIAHEKARLLRIPEDKAGMLADAIVGSLAVGQ